MEHLLIENYDHCCNCDTRLFVKGIYSPNSAETPSISILAGAIGSAFGCYLDSALSQAESFLSTPEG
jgi:hypothetical protein